jgi:dsDNA-binding SOS-regulon protein
MRIAGGRYRVTAAHRVVWTWINEFAPLCAGADAREEVDNLQVGDLVTMTIVDVFETDNQGKLLSYCPTFDNRAIHKTLQTAETLRKSRGKLMTALKKAQKSKLAIAIMSRAATVGTLMKQKVDEAVQNYNSPSHRNAAPAFPDDATRADAELHEC